MAFSLLVKPVSYNCNLRCRYCFYLEKEAMFGSGTHIMAPDLLERMVRDYMATHQETHVFCWQGGEPTLAGLPFFKEAVACMERFGGPGYNVANALQTNGTLIDDGWAEFFRTYSFLVGISLDGPAALHNACRISRSGKGSYQDAARGAGILRKHNVPFNALAVVSRVNVTKPLDVYRHLRDDIQASHHQYIEETEENFAVSAESWGEFLCAVFDEWYGHDIGRVSVRLFDSILGKMLTGVADSCAMNGRCGQYMVVEHDGSVYPCDFYVAPQWRLGMLGERTMDAFLSHPKAISFAKRKSALPQACMRCPYLAYCAGDCPRNRPHTPSTPAKSALCKGWLAFFKHAIPRLKSLKEGINRRAGGDESGEQQ